MPDITDIKGSDLLKYGLFGATGYDTNNKLVGYGVGFGTQKYTHDDGKEARNLVILGTNSSNGNIYSFSVDYELPTIDKIQKIHKYLMKKHNI